MDRTIKQVWLDALRSGRYEQTVEYLRDSRGYCCLGVLCDVLPPATGEWREVAGEWQYLTLGGREAGVVSLPNFVMDRVGLNASEPWVWVSEEMEAVISRYRSWRPVVDSVRWASVTNLNDSGVPFSVIADLVEQQPDDWDGTPPDGR